MADTQHEPKAPEEVQTSSENTPTPKSSSRPVQTKTLVLSLASSALLISFALYTLVKTDFKTYPKSDSIDIESVTRAPDGFAWDTSDEVAGEIVVVETTDDDHSVMPKEESESSVEWVVEPPSSGSVDEALVAELGFLKDRNLTLEYQVSERDREISSLRDQVEATHQLLQVAATTPVRNADHQIVAEEDEELAEEHARLTEQHETLQRHYGRIEGALSEARILLRDSLEAQQLLEAKAQDAEAKSRDQGGRRNDAENRLKDLSKRVDSLQKEKAQLQDKIVQQQHTLTSQETAFQELANAVKTYKEAIKRMDQSRMELASELDSTKRQYAKLLQAAGTQGLKGTTEPISEKVIATNSETPTGVVTPSSTAEGEARYHVVGKGDTLTSISRHYYGTSQRWHEVYDANKAVITDHNRLKVGLVLVIP
jgi:nucleoid-associated protein YgaU